MESITKFKVVQDFIEVKKEEFSHLPLFKFMQDQSITPIQRLAIIPCIAPFAMNFGDLNKYFLREQPPSNYIQELINTHTFEDDHHWVWFLEDIQKLGFDKTQSFSDFLKFMWSDETKATRLICSRIAVLLSLNSDPVLRLSIAEAIEATGHIMLFNSAQIIQELQKTTKQKYRYFGRSHFEVETGHPIGTDDIEQIVNKLEIEEENRVKAFKLVEIVFELFTEIAEEFLQYALIHKDDFKVKEEGDLVA